ncbi:hypothetical protein SUDANB121_03892 [Nocardiopsis dassonvillei]|uniref:hypothetical protein n=1 Tax=Nocardiopsis dassonvillei TaxID=2014 RepID=UPI003F571F1E
MPEPTAPAAPPDTADRAGPAGGDGTRHVLSVFDALRERPGRAHHRRLARMERRAARRRPVRVRDDVQRGDLAEPPPVLDLVPDDPADRDALLDALVERCGNQTPLRLPVPGTAAAPRAAEAAPDADDREPWATTDELYDLVGRLLAAADRDLPPAGRGRIAPPPPRFARLRSLLRLRACDRRAIHEGMSGSVAGRGDLELDTDRRTQIHVVAALGRIRSASRREGGHRTAPRWLAAYLRVAHGAAIRLAGLSTRITFGRLDAVLLTPVSFVIGVLGVLAPPLLGALGLATALGGPGPETLFGQTLQGVNNWIAGTAAVLLLIVYASLAPFLVLPWRAYRWLDDHADYEERTGLRGHRDRGIHVLNLLKGEADREGRLHPAEDAAPAPAPVHADRPRAWWELLLRLPDRGPQQPPAAATAPHPAPSAAIREYGPLPAVHRLAANALLDDLADTHGGVHRPLRPRRGRTLRPVLLVDQDRLDRVGRYLVRLIEDERVRRTLPDPLLIVQVRGPGTSPLVPPAVDATRYPSLPGTETTVRQEEVSLWRRARHAAGVLGASRTLKLAVPGVPADPAAGGPADRTVPTAAALTRRWTAGTGATLVLAVSLAWGVGPSAMAPFNPCVRNWLWEPVGIEQDGKDCYGATFGGFVFHDRLAEVTERIREQNDAVDAAGRGTPHVTVAYFGALSTTAGSDLALAGVQGELLGIAQRQAEHNASADASLPRIKVLLVSTGQGWSRAADAARMVVERAGRTRDRMDRPIAAIGFGQSLQGTTEAIRVLGAARIPVVGTTATFDDIAMEASGRYGQYFFPLAPANSRIAAQAAAWAYHGVEWDGTGLAAGEREPVLGPARTAVAIADNQGGESYGPHLAMRFMAAFRALGGEPWQDPDGTAPPAVNLADGSGAVVPGVLPYRDGEVSQTDHLARVCAQDPPDLIYFAGRSTDFADFHRRLQEEGMCVEAGIDVLGGDDIAKFVTDHAETIGRADGYPVFYTPLAAGGAWGRYTEGSERAFYAEAEALVEELYGDGDGERPTGTGPAAADRGLPSIAHAAMAADAVTVLSRALRAIDHPVPGGDAPPFLKDDEAYDAERDALVGHVQNTSGLSAVSGHIAFGEPAEGNWYAARMVQLVVVGPRGEDGAHQHVVAACGRISPSTVDPGPGCV